MPTTDDEEYERVKREIGWHATGWDCAFWACVLLLVMLLAWIW